MGVKVRLNMEIKEKKDHLKEIFKKEEKLDKCPKDEKDCQNCKIDDCPEEET